MNTQLTQTDNAVHLLREYSEIIDQLGTDAPELTVRSMDVNLVRYLCGFYAEYKEFRAEEAKQLTGTGNLEDLASELGDCYWFLARLATKLNYDFQYKYDPSEDKQMTISYTSLFAIIEKELRPDSHPRMAKDDLLNLCAEWDFTLETELQAHGLELHDVLQANIDKLVKRKAEGTIVTR